ncbi:hypothetical protein GCM10009854_00650 [Saccharopolyspora halophila]|uniref:Secreted protein n=1 Tax=Saccharopolyspora halophila TaxID=405551 RepID=A0ABN3FG88_9PSEU
MIYILAAVGAITVAVLLWKAFGADAISAARGPQRSAPPVAPDDDPDFLRRLDEQRKAEED